MRMLTLIGMMVFCISCNNGSGSGRPIFDLLDLGASALEDYIGDHGTLPTADQFASIVKAAPSGAAWASEFSVRYELGDGGFSLDGKNHRDVIIKAIRDKTGEVEQEMSFTIVYGVKDGWLPPELR